MLAIVPVGLEKILGEPNIWEVLGSKIMSTEPLLLNANSMGDWWSSLAGLLGGDKKAPFLRAQVRTS